LEPEASSEIVTSFKARSINPHLFEHASKLPFVERKSATNFQEFSLSRTNISLGKRTYNEYLAQQSEQKQFKARALDMRLFERKSICESEKPERHSSQPRTQFLPFNFKTDIRGQRKSKEPTSVKIEFKAREMPYYKFFEPKRDSHQPTKFVEFDLSTDERSKRVK
jgi:hypothetical protein